MYLTQQSAFLNALYMSQTKQSSNEDDDWFHAEHNRMDLEIILSF